jgi:cytosine/adenosine deaminase-related metal-dependent hydrolase
MTSRHPWRCACCDTPPDGTRRSLLGAAASLAGTGLLSACASTPGAAVPAGRNFILRGGTVVTMEPGTADLDRGDVHVVDGRIAAVAPRIEAAGAETVDASGMVLMPGMVETHWHLWNSLLKNMLRPGAEYFAIKGAMIDHHQPLDYYRANRLALLEALNAGITTVHNFAHNTRTPEHVDAELRAMQESGLRGRYSYGYIDPMPADRVMPLDDLRRVQREWFASGKAGPLLQLGMALRGDQGSSRTVFRTELDAARDMGLPKVMHIGQSQRFRVKVAELVNAGFIDRQTLLVHGLAVSTEDRAAIASLGLSLSYSPQSELRLQADGDFRTQLLLAMAARINLCLSIDATSLGAVSMFDAMHSLWNLGVPWNGTETEKLPRLDFNQCLAMATLNGAQAMGMADRVGSLKAGKRADIVMLRANDLNMSPLGEPRTALVRSATPANVDTVIVDGRFLKRGGQLLNVDVAQVVAQANESLLAIRQRAGGAWAPRPAG